VKKDRNIFKLNRMFNNMNNKRGLSPIISTILLVVIALSLFLLIFLWVKSFQGEKISKFNSPIENACQNVDLRISVIGSKSTLQIENDGNVPVYKVEVFEVTGGSSKKISTPAINLLAGKTTTISLNGNGCPSSAQIKVIPVLLGKTEKGAQKEYVCSKKAFATSC